MTAPVLIAALIIGNEPGDCIGMVFEIELARVFAPEPDANPDLVTEETPRCRDNKLCIMDRSEPTSEICVAPISKAVLYVNSLERAPR